MFNDLIQEVQIHNNDAKNLKKITANITKEDLENQDIIMLIQALNSKKRHILELVLDCKDLDAATPILISRIAPLAMIPVQIVTHDAKTKKNTQQGIEAFQNIIINNLHQPNKSQENQTEILSKPPVAKSINKIKLKALVKTHTETSEELKKYITVEENYVAEDQETVYEYPQQLEINEQDLNQLYVGELVGYEAFKADKYQNVIHTRIGNEEKVKNLNAVLQQELFANLTHAIKFLTPAAAEQFALYLPALVTLNKDNLPQGFVLKCTDMDELVLDYDHNLKRENTNIFTPKIPEYLDFAQPIYDLKFDNLEKIPNWCSDPVSEDFLAGFFSYISPHLVNLYILKGDKGVRDFFAKLGNTIQSFAALYKVFSCCLTYIPQWDDAMLTDDLLFTLEKMVQYDENKYNIMAQLLTKTDTNQRDFDFPQFIFAFEAFWAEYTVKCAQHKVSPEELNVRFDLPIAGNPVVFLERLQEILKNARNFKDQVEALKPIQSNNLKSPNFPLTNYGPYYASKYEGYTCVATIMNLNYDADKHGNEPFNRNENFYSFDLNAAKNQLVYEETLYNNINGDRKFYLINCDDGMPYHLSFEELVKQNKIERVTWWNRHAFVPLYKVFELDFKMLKKGRKKFEMFETLEKTVDGINDGYITEPELNLIFEEPPTKAQSFELPYRYIGQQSLGILVSDYMQSEREFKNDIPDIHKIVTLYFTTHERSKRKDTLVYLFKNLGHLISYPLLINAALNFLQVLAKLDVYLNELEGVVLIKQFSGMNGFEFQRQFENSDQVKSDIFQKLAECCMRNKYGLFKLLNARDQRGTKEWPLIYALDTAAFFAKDFEIAREFENDLLVFADLLNKEANEAFHDNLEPLGLLREKDDDDETFYKKEQERIAEVTENMQKVKDYLHEAAVNKEPNNLYYAIKLLITSKHLLGTKRCLVLFEEISNLKSFDKQAVEAILTKYQIAWSVPVTELFARDASDLRAELIEFLVLLHQKEYAYKIHDALRYQSNEFLQAGFIELWKKNGLQMQKYKKKIDSIFQHIKEVSIKTRFDEIIQASELKSVLAEKLIGLKGTENYTVIDSPDGLNQYLPEIVNATKIIIKNPYVLANEAQFIELLKEVDFSLFDAYEMQMVLGFFAQMPQRDFLPLARILLNVKKQKQDPNILGYIIDELIPLNDYPCPTHYLNNVARIVLTNRHSDFDNLTRRIKSLYTDDTRNPVLEYALTETSLSYDEIQLILDFAYYLPNKSSTFVNLLSILKEKMLFTDFAKELSAIEDRWSREYFLEIVLIAHSKSQPNDNATIEFDYQALISEIKQLITADLYQLHGFMQINFIPQKILLKALQSRNEYQEFSVFLSDLEESVFCERSPFQFDTAEVQRVVNNSKDLLNNTVASYQHRKQLMESFYFVNEIGGDLPVYGGKAVKDLSFKEIQIYFQAIKFKDYAIIPQLKPFQYRLLALALIREAMYRATGEFPNSTQIIAVIECMMHEGDFISNVDAGQGGSLMDCMKAALLYLDSDRVDITTYSIRDAKRAIENYQSFFSFLGIPLSPEPITVNSYFDAFQKNGVNYSTFSQLSLSLASWKQAGITGDDDKAVVSLVCNESDHAILDDAVIYRCSVSKGISLPSQDKWIYDAINEFVSVTGFMNNSNSVESDIFDLKLYLQAKAESLNSSHELLNEFSEADYLTWLESAILVQYWLQENEHFRISDPLEAKNTVHGDSLSKSAQIILKGAKINSVATYGNGMHQLLHSKLNKLTDSKDYAIKTQILTASASSNKNLIQYYRARNGFIWGCSATVGSHDELALIYAKYGIEFTKLEPHQQRRVEEKDVHVFDTQVEQFSALMNALNPRLREIGYKRPDIVFCRDIETAKQIYALVKEKTSRVQLYTGLSDEEEAIRNAAQPGMITIATAALGRNVDIPYNRNLGLNVWHTCIDSKRLMGQKTAISGREGSPATIYYFLNSQDAYDKSVTQVPVDRTEELYDVIGYLRNILDCRYYNMFKDAISYFYSYNWPQFVKDTETRFREHQRKDVYNRIQFIQETVNEFNLLLKEFPLKTTPCTYEALLETIDFLYPEHAHYKVFDCPVNLADCRPPISIAYELLSYSQPNLDETAVIKEVYETLYNTFNRVEKESGYSLAIGYARYLLLDPKSMNCVAQAHKQFLTKYLQECNRPKSFVERFLGYASKLKKIAISRDYLILFQALASTRDYNADVDAFFDIKKSILYLIDEYVQESWFINSDRRTRVKELRNKLITANSLEAIIAILATNQVELAQSDMVNSGFMGIKPLHMFGNSRYQNTLTAALNLSTALSTKACVGNLVADLSEVVSSENTVTHDEVQAELAEDSPKYARKTVLKCLDSAMKITELKGPEGMRGRMFYHKMKPVTYDTDMENTLEVTNQWF